MSRSPRGRCGRPRSAQWHARFRAANGEVVWTTESYKRRRAALLVWADEAPEIRDIDERAKS